MKLLPVSLVVFIKNDEKDVKLWMQKRNRKDPFSPWEFPGGKIKQGESPDTAACREIEEETGFVLKKNRLQIFTIHSFSKDPYCLCLFIHLYRPDFSMEKGRWFSTRDRGDWKHETFPANHHPIDLIARHTEP